MQMIWSQKKYFQNLNLMNRKNIRYNREFGILFSFVFILFHVFTRNDQIFELSIYLFISGLILFISLIKPKILSLFSYIWYLFGGLLGNFASNILLFLIFTLVLTPLSIFLKIIKSDQLNIKFKNKKSFWETSKKKKK